MKVNKYFTKFLLATSVISLGLASNKSSEAAFEWTPPKKVVEQEVILAPEEDALMPVSPEDMSAPDAHVQVEAAIEDDVNKAPVEYLQGEEPKEMVLKLPEGSDVTEDLKEIIEEAEDNNVITPIAEIPESEQIDEPVLQEQAEPKEEIVNLPQQVAPEDVKIEEVSQEETSDVIQGFGNDLPLIMAVRQIVPSDVPFAFGEGVDLGATVSWEGGADWQETLNKIAMDNELALTFDGDVVKISKLQEMSAPSIETVRVDSIQETEEIIVEEVTPETELDTEKLVVAQIPVMEKLSSEDIVVEMREPVETEEVIVLNEPVTENEVLEASISDAVIISPIEDMDKEIVSMNSNDNKAEVAMTEGTVIGPIDQPVETELDTVVELMESPSEDTLISVTNEDMNDVEIVLIEDEMPADVTDVIEDADIVIVEDKSDITSLVESTINEEVENTVPVLELPKEIDENITVLETAEIKEMAAPDVVVIDEPAATNSVPLQIMETEMVEAPAAMVQEITEDVQEKMIEVASIPQNMAVNTDLDMVKTWKVKKNSDLKKTLETWSEDVGVALDWKMSDDYSVDYMVWVEGNFEEAISVLMQGFNNQPGLIPNATIDMNAPTGPVLIIEPAA